MREAKTQNILIGFNSHRLKWTHSIKIVKAYAFCSDGAEFRQNVVEINHDLQDADGI